MLVENVIIGHVLRSLIICQRTYCTLIIKKIESYLAGTYLIYHCEEKELHVQNGLSYCTVQMHHSPNYLIRVLPCLVCSDSDLPLLAAEQL